MSFQIKKELLDWYAHHKRELPWRETTDPYRIWISEVILQQTRVAQGREYFNRFTARFPNVRTLAEADEDDVLNLWQGLGYYSRARNLHTAARQIMDRGGVFPKTYDEIRSLKGIGEYTAAAICSIAFGQPYAVVDGNVYRVLSRLFAIDLPIDSGVGKKHFAELAASLLDRKHPNLYNQAIMDFGAMQCLPKSPDCTSCPFHSACLAHKQEVVHLLPVKQGKTVIKARYFNYLHIRHAGQILIGKRTGKDIWQNLYEFPLIETEKPVDFEQLTATEAYQQLTAGIDSIRLLHTNSMPKHQLSHRTIHTVFYEMEWSNLPHQAEYKIIPESEIGAYPVSRLIEMYLETIKPNPKPPR